jgi:hypothetical protein
LAGEEGVVLGGEGGVVIEVGGIDGEELAVMTGDQLHQVNLLGGGGEGQEPRVTMVRLVSELVGGS